MSSFRIDRQYVSFETAEIHPVRTDNQDKKVGEPSASSRTEYVQDNSSEIIEQKLREAESKAEQIVDKAQFEAELTMSKARKTASSIIKEAQEKAGELLESAKREGYKDGIREAQEAAAEQKLEDEAQFQELAEKLKASYLDLVDSMQGDIVSIVMDISRKIIGIKLQESDAVFMGLVSGAVDQLKQAESITIHVSPEDYVRYFQHSPVERLFDDSNAKVTVIEDESYSTGDLVVETECEVLDLSVSKQINKVEKALVSKGE